MAPPALPVEASSSAFPHLFKALALKDLRLKNRITMAPLCLGYA
jgi:2,4-dienoyl-CoA reductase-like NADH-dependent reductase (Old Yellow Enzyme family)